MLQSRLLLFPRQPCSRRVRQELVCFRTFLKFSVPTRVIIADRVCASSETSYLGILVPQVLNSIFAFLEA